MRRLESWISCTCHTWPNCEVILSVHRSQNVQVSPPEKYNQTVIIITHDLSIAERAKRVITIEDGKIIKDVRN